MVEIVHACDQVAPLDLADFWEETDNQQCAFVQKNVRTTAIVPIGNGAWLDNSSHCISVEQKTFHNQDA